jgi:hypothetical protein
MLWTPAGRPRRAANASLKNATPQGGSASVIGRCLLGALKKLAQACPPRGQRAPDRNGATLAECAQDDVCRTLQINGGE